MSRSNAIFIMTSTYTAAGTLLERKFEPHGIMWHHGIRPDLLNERKQVEVRLFRIIKRAIFSKVVVGQLKAFEWYATIQFDQFR